MKHVDPEPLIPQLEEALITTEQGYRFVHHPFVVSLYDEHMNAQLNKMYQQKSHLAEQALERKRWIQYINWHERPYRTTAMLDLMDDPALLQDEEYWEVLSWVWIDQENPDDFPEVWYPLFASDRGSREWLMNEDERKAFAELPDMVTVYRGGTDGYEHGLSWTTERRVAEFFANRFNAQGEVWHATLPKTSFLCYLLSRNEYELIMDPREVPGGEAYL